MARIQVEETIRGTQADVFALAVDLHKWPEICSAIKRIEVLTDGPVGVGTRFRETREMFGGEATEEMEFTRIDPPNCYVVEANSCGMLYRTEFRFRQEGDSTKMTMEFAGKPLTTTAKIMGLLMMPLLKGMMP